MTAGTWFNSWESALVSASAELYLPYHVPSVKCVGVSVIVLQKLESILFHDSRKKHLTYDANDICR